MSRWGRDDDERDGWDRGDHERRHSGATWDDGARAGADRGRRAQRASRVGHREPDERRRPLELPRGPGRDRELVHTPRGTYRVRGSEVEALRIIGTFRTVEVSHLERFAYGDDRVACARDRENLEAQGLIKSRRVALDEHARYAVALTSAARSLLLASQPPGRDGVGQQRYYSDFGQPRDLEHDVALYAMVERERPRLEAEGLYITRVVLEAELISGVFSAWAAARRDQSPDGYRYQWPEELKQPIAEAHRLSLIDDSFQFPDVRLEVEGPNGERSHVDLELVTRHYGGGDLSLKAQAGFRLYAPHHGDVIAL